MQPKIIRFFYNAPFCDIFNLDLTLNMGELFSQNIYNPEFNKLKAYFYCLWIKKALNVCLK
jgi:hypothetical protein